MSGGMRTVMTNSINHPIELEEPGVSTAVVQAVADRSGVPPEELPPLFEAIEPDALDKLFQPVAADVLRRGGTVEFEYAGCRVRISLHRRIDITISRAVE